jgi:two-component system sensor kinase FixL
MTAAACSIERSETAPPGCCEATRRRMSIVHDSDNGSGEDPRAVRGEELVSKARVDSDVELRRQREELAHQARIAMMGELALSLAHELNQPLSAILTNAQVAARCLASDSWNGGDIREILHDIIADSHRAADVMRHARSLFRKEIRDFAAVDLGTILRSVTTLIHSDALLRRMRVSIDIEPDLPEVRGDDVQLQQVILNLLLNAFDSLATCAAEDRDVRVAARRRGPHAVIVSCSDRGTGMSQDALEAIFQPFYTTKREGLGMGLSLCRSIINAHGGRLWADNNTDRGASFFFTLPVLTAAESSFTTPTPTVRTA